MKKIHSLSQLLEKNRTKTPVQLTHDRKKVQRGAALIHDRDDTSKHTAPQKAPLRDDPIMQPRVVLNPNIRSINLPIPPQPPVTTTRARGNVTPWWA